MTLSGLHTAGDYPGFRRTKTVGISLLCPRGMQVYRGFTNISFVVFILHLAPVVQRLERALKRKIHYPVYKSYQSELSSLVDRDLSSE